MDNNLIYLVVLLSLLFWGYAKWESGHFRRKGIKNLPYDVPLLGNSLNLLMQKDHMKDLTSKVYKAFPNEKYVGYKQISRNVILIRDIELLRNIAIKDFDHFSDHLMAVDESIDSLFGKSLFSLKGKKWRDMRATLSPAFTSSKMKNMLQFVIEIAEQMTEHYIDLMKSQECKGGIIEIEMKDAFSRYTNDVIATSAFGIKVNSLKDTDNIFYEIGKDVSGISGFRFFKFFIFSNFPIIQKILDVQLYPDKMKKFFKNIILKTMQEREKLKLIRQDMIHLLMQARKGSLKHETDSTDQREAGFATVEESYIGRQTVRKQWSDDDIIAQGILFYAAGFGTTSSLLCFMAHELTINPDIQRRLQQEIDQTPLSESGRLDYNDLIKMTYMDMIVSETLRKWPPLCTTDRKCIKKYILPPSLKDESKECVINEGESIMIPIYAIHHDPKYYPDPEKFDPERFSEDNKGNINPLSYIPFGIGPRSCIASRFALMESKAVMFYMLKRFNFVRVAKTQEPLVLSTKVFTMTAENGFWIGLEPRN